MLSNQIGVCMGKPLCALAEWMDKQHQMKLEQIIDTKRIIKMASYWDIFVVAFFISPWKHDDEPSIFNVNPAYTGKEVEIPNYALESLNDAQTNVFLGTIRHAMKAVIEQKEAEYQIRNLMKYARGNVVFATIGYDANNHWVGNTKYDPKTGMGDDNKPVLRIKLDKKYKLDDYKKFAGTKDNIVRSSKIDKNEIIPMYK